jgi:uncharacterized repeat protein (TIGR04138 family)
MKDSNPAEILNRLIREDPRYPAEAYCFVQEGLAFTVKHLKDGPRHVSGPELLCGLRDYALQEMGPMALRVLREWGIHECLDFGHIVFNLVDSGLLGKTDEDSLCDFEDGYDFDEAFRLPFLPPSRQVEVLNSAP